MITYDEVLEVHSQGLFEGTVPIFTPVSLK